MNKNDAIHCCRWYSCSRRWRQRQLYFCPARTVPVLAAVPEKLTTVVEQPVEAASSEAEEETLPKLPYADGVYVGSSRGYGGAVRVQVTMENGSITEVEILDASHETKQFLRRAKRLLTTVVEAQSWEVDAVSEATYTSRGILGAVQNALTGEVVNNPLPPQPEPAAPLVVEEFTHPLPIWTASTPPRPWALRARSRCRSRWQRIRSPISLF